MDMINTVLLISGIAFIIAELVLPGGIVVWLGVSALLLVGARQLGYLMEIPDLFFAWIILSVGLVIFSVVFLQRFVRGEVEKNHFDDVEEAKGVRVPVLAEVGSGEDDVGRVLYQGTAWGARTVGPNIAVGEEVVIEGRENITWIVSALETEEGE